MSLSREQTSLILICVDGEGKDWRFISKLERLGVGFFENQIDLGYNCIRMMKIPNYSKAARELRRRSCRYLSVRTAATEHPLNHRQQRVLWQQVCRIVFSSAKMLVDLDNGYGVVLQSGYMINLGRPVTGSSSEDLRWAAGISG